MSRGLSSAFNLDFVTEIGEANCSLGSDHCFRIMVMMPPLHLPLPLTRTLRWAGGCWRPAAQRRFYASLRAHAPTVPVNLPCISRVSPWYLPDISLACRRAGAEGDLP